MDSYGPRLYLSKFSAQDEEYEFRRTHHHPRQARKIIVFGIIIYCLYLFLDYYLFPEYFRTILLIRTGIFLPAAAGLFLLTFSRFYYRFSIFIFMALSLMSAAGIILIEYTVRENVFAELYFYGTAQVLIVLYGTGKVSLWPSLVCGLSIVIPAIIVDTLFVESDIHRIVTKSFFMSTMLVLGVIVSSIIQHTSRDRFRSHQRVTELSMTDALTGLRNRLFYEMITRDEILKYIKKQSSSRQSRGGRLSDSEDNDCYAFILMDIDYFKRINDNYGHKAGDLVLKEFSDRVQKIIRASDVLIRWGGEEFLLLLRNTRMEYVEQFVQRIRTEISENLFKIETYSELITVSGGICIIYPESDVELTGPEGLFESADKALYFSKNNGRNRFTRIITDAGKNEFIDIPGRITG